MVTERFGEPLTNRRRRRVPPDDGVVEVRVGACGVCGTDVKIRNGRIPGVRTPIVQGHEIAGIISDLGETTTDLKQGQRVLAHPNQFCGTCKACRTGRHSLCTSGRGRTGFTRDGGFADYVSLPPHVLIPLPDSLSLVEAAPIPDSVATCWRGIKKLQLTPEEQLAVIGCGGLGLNAIQIAKTKGVRVLAVDVSPDKLERAVSVGADAAMLATELSSTDAMDNHLVEKARSWSDGGLDALIDCSGAEGALQTDVPMLRPGGRMVLLGYSPGVAISADSAGLVLDEKEILASRSSSYDELTEAVDMVARRLVRPQVDAVLALSEVDKALDALQHGHVSGRLVVVPDGSSN